MKADRVVSYWAGETLMIPNVFRLTAQIEFNNQYVLEYQDLSRKEVLAQNGGLKGRLEGEGLHAKSARASPKKAASPVK